MSAALGKAGVVAVVFVIAAALFAVSVHQMQECDARGGVLVKDAVGRHVCIDPRTLPAPAPRP